MFLYQQHGWPARSRLLALESSALAGTWMTNNDARAACLCAAMPASPPPSPFSTSPVWLPVWGALLPALADLFWLDPIGPILVLPVGARVQASPQTPTSFQAGASCLAEGGRASLCAHTKPSKCYPHQLSGGGIFWTPGRGGNLVVASFCGVQAADLRAVSQHVGMTLPIRPLCTLESCG